LANEVICVSADEDIRRERAIKRGMLLHDYNSRLALQASDEQRESISDTIFYNNGTLSALEKQVRNWYDERQSRLFST
ncbi:MAG: dephospho-CoA kinase, partial [Coriobacteriales bacterium]|nr:dephospho-CoA kinase [Coriobacteriales bacterium]